MVTLLGERISSLVRRLSPGLSAIMSDGSYLGRAPMIGRALCILAVAAGAYLAWGYDSCERYGVVMVSSWVPLLAGIGFGFTSAGLGVLFVGAYALVDLWPFLYWPGGYFALIVQYACYFLVFAGLPFLVVRSVADEESNLPAAVRLVAVGIFAGFLTYLWVVLMPLLLRPLKWWCASDLPSQIALLQTYRLQIAIVASGLAVGRVWLGDLLLGAGQRQATEGDAELVVERGARSDLVRLFWGALAGAVALSVIVEGDPSVSRYVFVLLQAFVALSAISLSRLGLQRWAGGLCRFVGGIPEVARVIVVVVLAYYWIDIDRIRSLDVARHTVLGLLLVLAVVFPEVRPNQLAAPRRQRGPRQ